MKLTIPTKTLVAALATIKTVAKPSTTHVVLGNVCITAKKGGITLLGMDLEKQISVTVPCSVAKEGCTTVACQNLHDSLAKARGSDCAIECNERHEMTIRVGSGMKRILGLDPSELPPRISSESGPSCKIDAVKLSAALSKVVSHSSSDKSRAQLCSVFVESEYGKLILKASDSRRACIVDTGSDFASNSKYIIPKESIPSMIATASAGDVEMVFSESAVTLRTENAEFASKLIEGSVPNFKGAFPTDRPVQITLGREDLILVIDYAEVETLVDAKRVAMDCDGKGFTVTGAADPEKASEAFMGANNDTVPVEEGSGKISLVVNPQYMRDALKCFSGSKVTLEMVDDKKAIVIQEPGITCMVMPLAPK